MRDIPSSTLNLSSGLTLTYKYDQASSCTFQPGRVFKKGLLRRPWTSNSEVKCAKCAVNIKGKTNIFVKYFRHNNKTASESGSSSSSSSRISSSISSSSRSSSRISSSISSSSKYCENSERKGTIILVFCLYY